MCTLRKPFDPVKSDIEMSKKLFFLITFSLSPTLFGHHNYRLQFDNSREVVMQGIVTNFEWKNPHLEIFFDVQNNKGEIKCLGYAKTIKYSKKDPIHAGRF